MKMIATYEGDGNYVVHDMIFFEEGNFYEIKINNEKVGEMTVKPAINSQDSVKPDWTAVETTKHRLSYQVSPDERKKGDPITITIKIQNKDATPVENAKVVLDMAMGDMAMGMDMGNMNMPMKMYMPVVSMGAHVLPQGKWRFEVHWTQMKDDEFKSNGSVVYPDMHMRMSKVINEIYYGLPNDMHLRVVIPYVNNKMIGTMAMGMMNVGIEGSANGLGDIMVILKKRFYNDMASGWSFAAGLGLKLPTGKDDEKFTDLNSMTQKFYNDYRLPIIMQPGTGEFDPILTGYITKSDSKGSWHGNFMYIYTSKANEDVDPGDKLMFNLARNFPITDRFILVGEINGMWQSDDDYPGRNITAGMDKHGTVISLTPGLQFKPIKTLVLEAAVKIPVVTPDDGMIPEPMFFIGGHIRF